MKIIQKLEVVFGFATLIAAIVGFYFEHIPLIRRIGGLNGEVFSVEALVRSLILFLLPAIFVFFGSYFHGVKRSSLAFTSLIIGGSILTLVFIIAFFSGAAFYVYGVTGALWRFAPHLLAMLTLIFAVRSRKLNIQ